MTSFSNHQAVIRPARHEDLPAIAALLIQLYAAELPGALGGPPDGQRELLHWTLEAKDGQGICRRFVAAMPDGAIAATAVMERPGDPAYERAPSGTIGKALATIGYRATGRLLVAVAQSMIGVRRIATPDAVFFHSVVVDTRYRQQGIGRALMADLEQQASADGYHVAWLQVLAANEAARSMYRRLGYEDAWSSPRWARLIAWPTFLMRKSL